MSTNFNIIAQAEYAEYCMFQLIQRFALCVIHSVNWGSWFCSHTLANSGKSSSVTDIRRTQSSTVLQANCRQVMFCLWKVTLTLHLCPVTVTYTHLYTTMQLCSVKPLQALCTCNSPGQHLLNPTLKFICKFVQDPVFLDLRRCCFDFFVFYLSLVRRVPQEVQYYSAYTNIHSPWKFSCFIVSQH